LRSDPVHLALEITVTILARFRQALSLSIAAVAMMTVSGCHGGGSAANSAPTPVPSSEVPVATSSVAASRTVTSQPSGSAERTTTAALSGNADACSLITEAEAGTALGRDPGPGQSASPSHCIYGAGSASINVVLQRGGKVAFDNLRAAMDGRAVDVPGVGDGAFGVFAGTIATVEFYKGDSLVAVNLVLGGATVAPKNQAIALARIAAPRS